MVDNLIREKCGRVARMTDDLSFMGNQINKLGSLDTRLLFEYFDNSVP